MAISGGDGSIILTTKVDTKGLDAAMAKMRQQAKGTGSAFESLSNFIKIQETRLAALRQQYASYVLKNEEGSVAAKKLASDIKNLSTSLTQNQARLNAASASAVSFGTKAKTAIAGVGASLKVLASYLIGIQTIFAVINFSKQSGEFATQTEASVQRLIDIYGEASESVGNFIDENAHALGMSKSAAAQFSSVYGNLFSVWADQKENAELTTQYLNATAVVASKTGRTMADVQERIRSGLLGNTEAVEDLGIFVNVKTIEITDAFKRIADGRSWEQLTAYEQSQVRTLAILEQATKKYGTEVADTTALTKARYNAAFEDFKNTWGKVVNIVLIPVLKVATQILNVLTTGLTTIAKLSGKTIDNSQIQQADSIQQSVENQDALTESVKETAEEQKKLLAGFDEITKLSETEKESTAGVVANQTPTTTGTPLTVDSTQAQQATTEISSTLATIMGVVGVALVALGLLLIVTGHIAWGIGFIIAGAAALSITMATLKSEKIGQDVKDKITAGLVIAGLVAVVLGILLCFAQHWGLGVSLIILGAATIVTAVSLNWSGVKQKLQGNLGKAIAIIGIVAIVIGILLCVAQQWGLGIGLIVAGAAAIATTVVANYDTIKTKVSEIFDKIMNWIKTWGLLVLGVILCITAVAIPLGLALIKKAADNLAQSENPKWEEIGTKIQDIIKGIGDWLKTWGLLVLGIILIISGVGIALGLALVIKAGQNLTEAQSPLWNTIVGKVQEVWNSVKQFWNTYIAKYFTYQWWSDLAKSVGNGFIGGFESAVNGIITLFENMINWIVSGLNSISVQIPDWVPTYGGNRFGVNLPYVNLGRVSIPRLATGAVIPGGREFLAVLGDQPKGQTNIETPLQTMIDAFNIALSQRDSGNQTIVLTVDGDVLFRTVVNKNRDYVNAMGVNPLGV